MFGDRVSLYLTQHVVWKRAEDNRNDYPLVVAMIPDMADLTLPWRLKMKLEKSLESWSERQASKYGVDFGGFYGEGAHYIKMEQARRRWI